MGLVYAILVVYSSNVDTSQVGKLVGLSMLHGLPRSSSDAKLCGAKSSFSRPELVRDGAQVPEVGIICCCIRARDVASVLPQASVIQ